MGKIAGADNFVAAADYISIPDADSMDLGTEDFTLSLWFINRNNYVGTPKLLNKGPQGTGNHWYNIRISSANLNMQTYVADASGSYYVSESFSSPSNMWAHLALSVDRDGGQVVYLNGVSVDTSGATSAVDINSTSAAFIGAQSSGNGEFDGRIDEVRVEHAARTEDWVKTTFNNQNAPGAYLLLGAEMQRPPHGSLFLLR